MYVEDVNGNSIGIIGKQQADTIASKIEADREKGASFCARWERKTARKP